jgi:hypothetical protein
MKLAGPVRNTIRPMAPEQLLAPSCESTAIRAVGMQLRDLAIAIIVKSRPRMSQIAAALLSDAGTVDIR